MAFAAFGVQIEAELIVWPIFALQNERLDAPSA